MSTSHQVEGDEERQWWYSEGKFGISLNRERVRRMLWKSPVDFVIEGPLNPTPAEEIQKDRGFRPVEYASVINND